MLSYFFRQLMNSCGVFLRTIRAFFTRKLTGVGARLKQMTNFSRQATKVASETFQSAITVVKKPSKREDYIETKRLFVSKSFLILLFVGLVVVGFICYYFVWPFLLSRFFVARFYEQDRRVADWTGQVIVCSDKAKRTPIYAGRLEEGVLQGMGTEYDDQGLVIYEGNFVSGVRNGAGKAYEQGVLTYEGNFVSGARSGAGKAYEQGVLTYAGSFESGLPSGRGTAYWEDGTVAFRGQFAEGIREGQGMAYYPDGARAYEGGYAADLREGEGSEFDETGRLRYKGGFSQDMYNGEGVYYPSQGQSISASFSEGVTGGVIQWYLQGKLFYDGGAEHLTPSGYGTVYATSGQPVYQGEMAGGTLDGRWLLGLTAGELRQAFGEARLMETTDVSGGFTITNTQLGATALCSYAKGGEDAQVRSVYLYPAQDGPQISLMPGTNGVELNSWLKGTTVSASASYTFPPGIPVAAGIYNTVTYTLENGSCTMFLQDKEKDKEKKDKEKKDKDKEPALICWSMDLPPTVSDEAEEPATEVVASEAWMEAFLDTLDLAKGAVTGISAGDTSPASDEAQKGDAQQALAAMTDPQAAQTLIDAYLSYLESAERSTALEKQKSLKQELLADEETLLSQGGGSQETADALKENLETLSAALDKQAALRKKAQLVAESVGGQDPAGLELYPLNILLDPAELDPKELLQVAVSYAKSVAETPEKVRDKAIELEIKLLLINLGMSYGDVQNALSAYKKSFSTVQAASKDFAMGSLSKAELYGVQGAQTEARGELYATLAAFTRQVNALNSITGGWVCEAVGWNQKVLLPLYEAEAKAKKKIAEEKKEAEKAGDTVSLPSIIKPKSTAAADKK